MFIFPQGRFVLNLVEIFKLAKGFQRSSKYESLQTDDGQNVKRKAHEL